MLQKGLFLLLVLDLTLFVAWVALNATLLFMLDASLEPYRTVHATYAVHSMATLRLIYVCSSETMHKRWPHTMAVFALAFIYDAFNVISTHLYTPQTVLWAWACDVALAYSFVTMSAFMLVLFGAANLELGAHSVEPSVKKQKRTGGQIKWVQ